MVHLIFSTMNDWNLYPLIFHQRHQKIGHILLLPDAYITQVTYFGVYSSEIWLYHFPDNIYYKPIKILFIRNQSHFQLVENYPSIGPVIW